MELWQFWKITRRWWWLIALPALAAGAYGAATYQAPAAAYAATLRFTAGQPESLAPNPQYDSNYYRWITSEYIVSGLKDWVRTGNFAEAVSQELAARDLSLPAPAVAGALAADNARSVLAVYLTWGNAEQLPVLAEAVTFVLQNRNAEVFPQLGGQPAVVVALDQPAAAPVAPSLRARLDLPLKLGLGLAAGLALALAAHYLDPFVRDRSDLQALGLAVVAAIPRPPRRP